MAKQIAGPNLNMIKSPVGNLSTNDLINTKAGVTYSGGLDHYVNPVYYSPYLGAGAYSQVLGNPASQPLAQLYSVSKATSLVSQSGADLGVDYSEYSKFIHFGSALERLSHFRDKLESIHYHGDQSLIIQVNLNATSQYQSQSIDEHINAASVIFSEFDGYDRYLYFETGSKAWPKDANGALYEVDSTQGQAWYNSQTGSAEEFDLQNQNRLINTLPDYIREDSVNNPALVFCDMIGQHYDNLLLFADGISQKHNADNRLQIGVSRDLVAQTLKGFGVKLYESQLNTTDLMRLYVGSFHPTGSEQINTMVSASDAIPSVKDQIDQTHKRIYHNLPHLLQTKGTRRGLRALINAFGIPSDNLEIREFGGINREVGQNFGAAEYITGSLGKVRLDNTGSFVLGDTLSPGALTYQPDTKYTQDIHVVEVGWSTNKQKDDFITGSLSPIFEIDNYIGDPRDKHKATYSRLEDLSKQFLANDQKNTLYDFLRLLRYFDNSIFSMLQDFVPARTSIRKGAIIKPHLLERNKAEAGFMSQSFHQLSASLDVYTVDGGPSETWDDHSTEHTQIFPTATGYVTESMDSQKEKYDGELGGSTIQVSDGELNSDNTLKNNKSVLRSYDTTKYTNENNFRLAPVQPGKMLLYYYDPMQVSPNNPGGGIGGPVGGGGGTVYSQSLSVNFLYNLALDVNNIQVSIQNGSNFVASVSNPSDADVIYSVSTLEATDTVTIHLSADGQENPPASFDVEILQGGTVVASDAASFGNAFTNYTYTVPTLSAQGTSVTFNLKVR